jgi:hypothetical protein
MRCPLAVVAVGPFAFGRARHDRSRCPRQRMCKACVAVGWSCRRCRGRSGSSLLPRGAGLRRRLLVRIVVSGGSRWLRHIGTILRLLAVSCRIVVPPPVPSGTCTDVAMHLTSSGNHALGVLCASVGRYLPAWLAVALPHVLVQSARSPRRRLWWVLACPTRAVSWFACASLCGTLRRHTMLAGSPECLR